MFFSVQMSAKLLEVCYRGKAAVGTSMSQQTVPVASQNAFSERGASTAVTQQAHLIPTSLSSATVAVSSSDYATQFQYPMGMQSAAAPCIAYQPALAAATVLPPYANLQSPSKQLVSIIGGAPTQFTTAAGPSLFQQYIPVGLVDAQAQVMLNLAAASAAPRGQLFAWPTRPTPADQAAAAMFIQAGLAAPHHQMRGGGGLQSAASLGKTPAGLIPLDLSAATASAWYRTGNTVLDTLAVAQAQAAQVAQSQQQAAAAAWAMAINNNHHHHQHQMASNDLSSVITSSSAIAAVPPRSIHPPVGTGAKYRFDE